MEVRMDYPWTDYFNLGIVVPAFYQNIRLRQGPVQDVIRKIAEDPFFQAMEFSGAEDPAARKRNHEDNKSQREKHGFFRRLLLLCQPIQSPRPR